MELSEHERRLFDEIWSQLPPMTPSRRFRLRVALRARALRTRSWLRAAFPVLAAATFGIGMIVFAGLLFHNGYAAGTAGTIGAGVGVLIGAIWAQLRN